MTAVNSDMVKKFSFKYAQDTPVSYCLINTRKSVMQLELFQISGDQVLPTFERDSKARCRIIG